MTVHFSPASGRPTRLSRYLAPAALVMLLAAVVVVVVSAPRAGPQPGATRASHVRGPNVPPYWIVRPGDTLTEIAAKSHVTVAQLEDFNPRADPGNLVPGQRLNLWQHPPGPRPRPPGPRFWVVRPGDSFGAIAAHTGVNIIKLEQLNRHLTSTTLQPGDRVRLRP